MPVAESMSPAFAAELDRRVRRIVWCTMATADPRGRPRTRIVHPWWEGSTAWLTTRPASPKLAHLEAVPWASLLYWDPSHRVVMAECAARLERDAADRARVWEGLRSEPPPYGFDPAEIFEGGPGDPPFGLLRLDAWRIELAGAPGEEGPPDPAIWRRPKASGPPAPPA